jgi:hybrid cluster-associated redox disulfide protein
MEISKHTKVETALKAHPESFKVFYNYGLACIRCSGAAAESIGRGAEMHGVDVESLLRDLNYLTGGIHTKGR